MGGNGSDGSTGAECGQLPVRLALLSDGGNTPQRKENVTEHQLFVKAPYDRKGRIAWINSNERYGHWAVRAEKTRAWRLVAKIAAQNAGLPKGLERAHITCTVHKTTNRSYDAGNLSPTAKAIVDGLVSDYGLLPDDSNEHVVGPDMRPGEKRDQAGITITIKETT